MIISYPSLRGAERRNIQTALTGRFWIASLRSQ
jgi:hypothetical protein